MARRVDTKFVAILGVSVAVALAVAFAAKRWLIHKDAEPLAEQARVDERNHDWKAAVSDWRQAIAITRTNASYHSALGDALQKLAPQDPAVNAKHEDLAEWQTALELDPSYIPAAHALFLYWRNVADQDPVAESLKTARDAAERIHSLAPNDPDDRQVVEYLNLVTVTAYDMGLNNDAAAVDKAIQQIQQFILLDPANAELPFAVARVDLRRATDLTQLSTSGEPDSARQLFKACADEMEEALKTQSLNPLMNYRAAQIYGSLARFDADSSEKVQYYQDRASERYDRAVALLKGDEPSYVEIVSGAAGYAIDTEKDLNKANSIMQDAVKRHTSQPDVIAQLSLLIARMPDLRTQAIDILEAAVATGGKDSLGNAEYNELNALTFLQMIDYSLATDNQKKAALHEQVMQNLAQMKRANFNPAQQAILEAQMDLADQNSSGAIQVLTDVSATDQRIANNTQVLWIQAQAYDQAGEKEEARTYLKKVIEADPDMTEARIGLAEKLIGDTTDEGQQELNKQMDFLMRNDSQNPKVIELEILRLDPQKDNDQITYLYNQLPERTELDLVAKFDIARQRLENLPEARRLMEAAIKIAPADSTLYLNLADVEIADKNLSRALTDINDGLAVDPKSVKLLLLQKEITDAGSPDRLNADISKIINQYDPADRDRLDIQRDDEKGDLKGEEQILLRILQQNPNDHQAMDSLFSLYCRMGRWDDAQTYLQKLTAINADKVGGLLDSFHLAQAKQDKDAEMALARQLLDKYPEFARSYWAMGVAYQTQGQFALAIQNYETALKIAGDMSDALAGEAACLYQLNQPDNARIAIEDALSRYPNDWTLQSLEAAYQLNFGDPAKARDIYDHQRIQNPNSPEVWLDEARAAAVASVNDSKIGATDKANIELRQAVGILYAGAKRFPDDLRMYRNLSSLLLAANSPDSAAQTLEALQKRPAWKDRPEPLVMLSDLYTRTNKPDKAEAMLRQAFDVSGHNANVEMLLCKLLSQEKKFSDAVSLLQTYNPTDPNLRRQEIAVLIDAGSFDQAVALVSHLVQGNPPDVADLHRLWAQLLQKQGKLADASDQIEQALQADPNNVGALTVRATLRESRIPPDLQGAQADLENARTINPANVDVLINLANVYFSRFNEVDGCHVLEQVIRLNPNDLATRLRLAAVYKGMNPPRLDEAMNLLKDGESLDGGLQSADLADEESYVYAAMNRFGDALAVNQAAMKRMPSNGDLIHCQLSLLISAKQFNPVLQETNELLTAHKDIWWLWEAQGEAKVGLGDKAGATQDLATAFNCADAQHDVAHAAQVATEVADTIGPAQALQMLGARTDPVWDTTRIKLYQMSGDFKSALQLVDSILGRLSKASPMEQEKFYSLAGQLYQAVRPIPLNDKAYAVYKQALAIKADDVQVLNNLAYVCVDSYGSTRAAEGLAYAQSAMDQLTNAGTGDPFVEDTYAWALIANGQYSKAIAQLNDVIAHKPFAEAYYHLAVGYYRMNDMANAQRVINQAYGFIATNHVSIEDDLRVKIDKLSNEILTAQANGGPTGG